MNNKDEHEWYFGWVSAKPVQEAAMDALKRYIEKFGIPPSIILTSPEETLQPMDGWI